MTSCFKKLVQALPYSTFEKCAAIIIDIEKIQKVKVNREDANFVDI